MTGTDAKTVFKQSLGENDYKIMASGISGETKIQLRVGKNEGDGLEINKSGIKLQAGTYYIDLNSGSSGNFVVGKMQLTFDDSSNKKIVLKNNQAYINITETGIILDIGTGTNKAPDRILFSNGYVSIQGNVGLKVAKTSDFDGGLYVKDKLSITGGSLYAANDLYAGYNEKTKKTKKALLYLYHNNKGDYVQVSAQTLKTLFDWYTKSR